MWRSKTALSPKKIALWPLWIVSCTSFCQVGDLEHTCRTLDCWDSHFPTNKGPKYLQYSNSLNNTCIFHFIQLFSTMSIMYPPLHTHSCFQTGPFGCFEMFLNPPLASWPSLFVKFFPVALGLCPRPSIGLSAILHTKQSKKHCVSEVKKVMVIL